MINKIRKLIKEANRRQKMFSRQLKGKRREELDSWDKGWHHCGEHENIFWEEQLTLLLKKRSSKRRRSSPKGRQSNVRKADVARRAKRRTE